MDRRKTERRRAPGVGVGCIVVSDGKLLLVQNHAGFWSTPGGHLDYGECPADCAAREASEEAGVEVSDVRFVALTNDVMEERERHYVTVWMLGVPSGEAIDIRDTSEIKEAGWYPLTGLPAPLHPYFENLLAGRCLPPQQPEAWLRSV